MGGPSSSRVRLSFISRLQPAGAAGAKGEWCGIQTVLQGNCLHRMSEGQWRKGKGDGMRQEEVSCTYSRPLHSPRRQGCPGQAPRATQEGQVSSFAPQAQCPSSPFLGGRGQEDLLPWIQFHPQSVSEFD